MSEYTKFESDIDKTREHASVCAFLSSIGIDTSKITVTTQLQANGKLAILEIKSQVNGEQALKIIERWPELNLKEQASTSEVKK